MWSGPEQEILIVDQFTGRTMEGRRFRWAPLVIEAKRVKISSRRNEDIRLNHYQNMFQAYKKIVRDDWYVKLRKMNSVRFTTCESFRLQLTVHSNVLTTMTSSYSNLDAKSFVQWQDVKRRYEKDSQSLLVRLLLKHLT